MKKKILLSVAVAGLVFSLTGCGNSSSSNSTTSTETTQTSSTQTAKSVKVVDGYVIGAQVCDENNVCATTDANGIATANFADTILTSKAGYIDVNYNNEIDDNDIKLPDTFTLKAPAGAAVVSPITDLIANGADTVKLAKILGISEDELYTDPIATNNVELAKAMQIVYAIKIDGKEAEFINAINDTNTTTNSANQQPAQTQSDLPNFGSKVASDLPDFGSDTTSNVAQTENPSTTTTATTAGSLTSFANLALSVVTDENAKTLINQVVSLNVTDVKEIETTIATLKKDLVKEETSQTENITNEEVSQTENTTNEEVSQTENTTNEEVSQTENTTNEEATTQETTQSQTTNETTSSAQSDLPVW